MLTATANPTSLAKYTARARDNLPSTRLRANGPVAAQRYTWTATARHCLEICTEVQKPPLTELVGGPTDQLPARIVLADHQLTVTPLAS